MRLRGEPLTADRALIVKELLTAQLEIFDTPDGRPGPAPRPGGSRQSTGQPGHLGSELSGLYLLVRGPTGQPDSPDTGLPLSILYTSPSNAARTARRYDCRAARKASALREPSSWLR